MYRSSDPNNGSNSGGGRIQKKTELSRGTIEMKSQDISFWSENLKKGNQRVIDDAKKAMGFLNIDIDDDMYWFTYTGLENTSSNSPKEIRLLENLPIATDYSIWIWEIYRIHSSMNITDLAYANFTPSINHLVTVEGDKWQRRRDLKVNILIRCYLQLG